MLYSFLNSGDLDSSIKEEMLTQLVRDDLGLVALAEATAVSWMKDYLTQRYDVAAAFPLIGEWAAGNDYAPARLVVVDAPATEGDTYYGPIYYYERPEPVLGSSSYTPLYDYNDAGRLTNYAWHEGHCYEARTASLGIEPGNDADFPLWPLAWRRDPRDPKLVAFATDIALFNLFKRVAPRKVPDLRVSLYNQAKEWLTMVRDGSLTPDLPRPIKVADNSDTIRWGSNPAQRHYY